MNNIFCGCCYDSRTAGKKIGMKIMEKKEMEKKESNVQLGRKAKELPMSSDGILHIVEGNVR